MRGEVGSRSGRERKRLINEKKKGKEKAKGKQGNFDHIPETRISNKR